MMCLDELISKICSELSDVFKLELTGWLSENAYTTPKSTIMNSIMIILINTAWKLCDVMVTVIRR